MSAYSIIRQAILDKHQIVAMYKGYRREMCPHVIGLTDGKQHALFYQFGGESSSGLDPKGSPNNWRCMFVEDLTNVSSHPGPWHTAPNHSRPQRCVAQVDVEVK